MTSVVSLTAVGLFFLGVEGAGVVAFCGAVCGTLGSFWGAARGGGLASIQRRLAAASTSASVGSPAKVGSGSLLGGALCICSSNFKVESLAPDGALSAVCTMAGKFYRECRGYTISQLQYLRTKLRMSRMCY